MEAVGPPRLEFLNHPRMGLVKDPVGHDDEIAGHRPSLPAVGHSPQQRWWVQAKPQELHSVPAHPRDHNSWGGSACQMGLKPAGRKVGLGTAKTPALALTPTPPVARRVGGHLATSLEDGRGPGEN